MGDEVRWELAVGLETWDAEAAQGLYDILTATDKPQANLSLYSTELTEIWPSVCGGGGDVGHHEAMLWGLNQANLKCKCSPVDVDQQRARYITSEALKRSKLPPKSAPNQSVRWHAHTPDDMVWPNVGEAAIFGAIKQRNSLARKLARGQLSEQVLYALEDLLAEAQGCLEGSLASYTSLACIHLSQILSYSHSTEPPLEFCIPYSHHEPMIQEPVPWQGRVKVLEALCEPCSREESTDSGLEGSDNGSMKRLSDDNEDNDTHLSQLVAFRACSSIQLLVKSSCLFFEGLINENALFRWFEEKKPEELLTLRELQLMACVEFQKLRSMLRYQWLADCLIHLRATRKILSRRIDGMSYELLRHLLRDEFLKRALERLCELLEAHQSKLNSVLASCSSKQSEKRSWKLKLPVRLVEAVDNPSLAVAASQSQQELKDTLDAVVRELVAACTGLPNLDPELPLSSHSDHQQKLPVLYGVNDDLVEHFLARIHHLVESGFSGGAEEPVRWLAREHENCLELLNRMRQAPAPTHLSSCHLSASERIGHLEAAQGQLRDLETQATILQCNFDLMNRDLGLVVLDCKPLNESLLDSVRKEQLMMERMVVDDSVKLLHQLRLQFEEIQLGVDLDTVVEDYLSERRRATAAATQPPPTTEPLHLQVFNEESMGDRESVSDVVDAMEQQQQQSVEMLDEELLMRLEGGSSNLHMQLVALTSGSGDASKEEEGPSEITMTKGGGGGGSDLGPAMLGQRSSPIPTGIECRLLVECYRFLDELLGGQLTSLRQDLLVFFESLIFMGEQAPGLWGELLEAGESSSESSQWALAGELVQSARQLGGWLKKAEEKLNRARQRLSYLNVIRSLTMSRLVIEFRLLINEISQRRLPGTLEPQASLDSIQEAANWARQLEIRARYLCFQNRWIAREAYLLSSGARLRQRQQASSSEATLPLPVQVNERTHQYNTKSTSKVCEELLTKWGQLAKLLAELWSLAELFETQQVKWLNSDLKQLDYRQLASVLESLKLRLGQLKESALIHYTWDEKASTREQSLKQVFESNLSALEWRLNQFELLRLPLFSYFAGRHVNNWHSKQWAELASSLDQNHPRLAALDTCTTLAQLLEYGIDKQVDKIEAMAERERVEREIEKFLELEFSRVPRSRHLTDTMGCYFEGWSEAELELAALKYLERKMSSSSRCDIQLTSESELLAKALVTYHSLVKRFLRLNLHLNLISLSPASTGHLQHRHKFRNQIMLLLPYKRLSSPTFINSSSFVELIRLAANRWLEGRQRLEERAQKVSLSLADIEEHLRDLEALMERARSLKDNELREVSAECERTMCKLECQTAQLEIEREILATKEALALGQQRQALATRDECIRQVTERAIPALRAATKALDSFDSRSLRFLCALKPAPPEPVKVVLEAVCLLRCRIAGEDAKMEPERRFDALSGRMLEDFWPPTSRLLNGTHSSRLVSDLRLVGMRPISGQLMRFIRRHYLSSSAFRLACGSSQVSWPRQVSRECGLLAKWLLAVDVFCRVINVVRPRYQEYLEAEQKLNELMSEVSNRRRQIESVASELRGLEDWLEKQKVMRATLAGSLDQCQRQLSRAEGTRCELERKRSGCIAKLARISGSQVRLVDRCALRATQWLYAMALQEPGDGQILHQLLNLQHNLTQANSDQQ